MIFVDTNYFLRFLLKDVNKQHEQVKRLFREGALGKVSLCTSLIVFFEIYWVFSSFYKKQKSELVNILEKTLEMEFIKLEGKQLLQEAIEVFARSNFDLEGAFNLVCAKSLGVRTFKTFDKKLAVSFKKF